MPLILASEYTLSLIFLSLPFGAAFKTFERHLLFSIS